MHKSFTLSKQHKQQGFTLIEIMVVVVILGILAAIVVPKIMGRPEQARLIKAKHDIQAIQTALDLYKLDNGFYPTTNQGLSALINKPLSAPLPSNWKVDGYLQQIPDDPWGKPYQYLNPGEHNKNSVDIFTYGPTGLPSSTDENIAMGNWVADK